MGLFWGKSPEPAETLPASTKDVISPVQQVSSVAEAPVIPAESLPSFTSPASPAVSETPAIPAAPVPSVEASSWSTGPNLSAAEPAKAEVSSTAFVEDHPAKVGSPINFAKRVIRLKGVTPTIRSMQKAA